MTIRATWDLLKDTGKRWWDNQGMRCGAAVAFYSKLFAVEPNKRQPGYANFAVSDPPLKLVLFEKPGAEHRLNHLGVEVTSSDDVRTHQTRLSSVGLEPVDDSGS